MEGVLNIWWRQFTTFETLNPKPTCIATLRLRLLMSLAQDARLFHPWLAATESGIVVYVLWPLLSALSGCLQSSEYL